MSKTSLIMLVTAVFLGLVAGFSVKTKWNDIQTILNYRATKNIIELMQNDNSAPEDSASDEFESDGWE